MCFFFFFSSRRRHTRCALVTGVQTCALPIYDPQIGQRIADFGPLIEAEAAHDPVGQADRNEAVLELAGLELGADQDRAILRPAAAGDMRLDPFADEAGLLDRKSTRLNSSH